MIKMRSTVVKGFLRMVMVLLCFHPALSFASVSGYTKYFVPGDEVSMARIFSQFGGALTDTTMHSIITVTAWNGNTTLYYDHWEDGYDLDLANPAATADEIVTLAARGSSHTFESSNVPTAPRGTGTYYDGRDYIYAVGGTTTMTRTTWTEERQTVQAVAWEIYPVEPQLTTYILPFGEDLSGAPKNLTDFTRVFALIQATNNTTSVTVDFDGDGVPDPLDQNKDGDCSDPGDTSAITLNKGEVFLLDDANGAGGHQGSLCPGYTVNKGTVIKGSETLQVQYVVGSSVNGNYETRGFSSFPRGLWSNKYYAPVDGAPGGFDTDIFLHNPNTAIISINYETQTGNGTFTVAAGDTVSFQAATGSYVPSGSGVYLEGSDIFWGVSTVDTKSSSYEWGYPLVPSFLLNNEHFMGWAPSSYPITPARYASSGVFITPAQDNTLIYIDLNNDGTPDQTYTLNRLQSQYVYDGTDGNLSGAHIWGTGPYAMAFGENSEYAALGTPSIDLGYTALPGHDFMDMVLSVKKSASPVFVPTAAGSQSTFTLTVSSADYSVDGIAVTDTLPTNWQYVAGTTTITLANKSTISGASADPAIAGSDLSWPAATLGNTAPNQQIIIQFTAQTTSSFPAGAISWNKVVATGTKTVGGVTQNFTSHDFAYNSYGDMVVSKSSSGADPLYPGDQFTYTVKLTNPATSGVTLTGVAIYDPLPAGVSYVPGTSQVTHPSYTYTDHFADTFPLVAYTNNADNIPLALLWNTDWYDSQDNIANAGDIRVVNDSGSNRLRITNQNRTAMRKANLSGYFSAILSFDRRRNGMEAGDTVVVEACDSISLPNDRNDQTCTNGWKEITRFSGPATDAAYSNYSFNLAQYLTSPNSANFGLRFRSLAGMDATDIVYFDNVRIDLGSSPSVATVPAGTNPNFVSKSDGYFLKPDESLTLTFDVIVDDPLAFGISSLTNIASINTDQTPLPVEVQVTNNVVNPTSGSATAGNRVWLDTDGNGIQDSGESGLANITVVLRDQYGTPITTAITDSNGNYIFTGIPPGTGYYVEISDGLPAGLTQSAPNGHSDNRTDPFNLVAGQTYTDANLGYTPSAGTANLGNLVWGDTNTNSTLDSGELGIGGVTVQLYLDTGDGILNTATDTLVSTTTTAVDGSYLFTGVTAGGTEDYFVYIDTSQPALSGYSATTATSQLNSNVNSGAILLNNDFGFNPPAGSTHTIQDRVWYDINTDGSDSGEDGIAGVTVALLDSSGNTIATTVTDINGYFAFSGVPGGNNYTVKITDSTAVLPNYYGTTPEAIAKKYDIINLSSNISNTNFGYNLKSAIGDSVYIDTNGNNIRDAGESGIPGVTVNIHNDVNGNGIIDAGDIIQSTQATAANGIYMFSGLADGNYIISIDIPPVGYLYFGSDSDPASPGQQLAASVTSGATNLAIDFGYQVPTPSLGLAKTGLFNDENNDTFGQVGETISYSFALTNTGNVTLNNVAVSDPLAGLSVITCPSGNPVPSIAPGNIVICSASYTLSQADVDAGQVTNSATADSDETDPPISDSETVSVTRYYNIAINKPAPVNGDNDASGSVTLGDVLTYTITATNTGTTTLNNVVVSDSLITPTGGTTPCATVAPGSTCTLIGTYTVTQADVDASQVFNTATADSDETDPPVTDTETTPVAQTASLAINKPAPANADNDASGSVTLGDVLTYTITATNTGTTTLNNVTVSDSLITPTGGTTPCATVAPGSTCTLIGTYTVTQADVDAGQVFNTATADSDETDPPVTDTETTPVAQTTSLAVNKPAPVNADNDASGTVTLNDVLTYTITATNTGTTTLNNVTVSDSLITPTGGTTPCAIVAPGGTCTLIGTYTVTQADVDAGQVFNTATADSDETDPPVTDTETTPVAQTTSLAVNKPAPVNADNDASGTVTLNDVLTYTITATNTGTTTLNNVTVSDSLITPTGGTTPCATVAPGGTCTLIGTYTVTQADVDAGQVFNTATADSDETDPPVTDTETTPVAQTTSLAVNKPAPVNADNDASGTVTLNDVLTYTVTATNTGTTTLNNVVVSDSLITPTGGTTPCATVAPGSTCTLIGTYTVTQADVDAGQVFNTATADSDETDPPITDTETTPVAQTASLAINKPAPVNADNDASGTVTLNDVLTYTVTATNTGTTTLNNVTVSDSLITPTGGTTPCATVAPGGTCTLIGTYTVTQADVDAGQVFNTATADSDETDPPVTDTETTPVAQTTSLAVNKPAPVNADNDASGTVTLNDVLTYTITATNTGSTTLNNVTVSDSLITPTGGTTPCASVAPGGTCILIGTYTVTQADVDAGQVFNTATADSDETDPPVTDTETTPVAQTTSLAVNKPAPVNADNDASGTVTLGDVLTYTVTATNTGTTTLNNVVVSDSLITPTGGTTPCATVAPGSTCSLIGTYTVTQADVDAGQVFNTATADSDETDPPVTDTETTPVAQTTSLAVNKPAPVNADNDASGTVTLGDVLTYTVTATNTGTTTLNNVVVSDSLITPTGGTTPCATVAPSSTCSLIGTYTVTQADVDAGQVFNTATADSDETDPPVTDTETTPVAQTTSLAVNKPAPVNADNDASGTVTLGDVLTYTVTATNTGTTTLNNVVVSDSLITPTGGTTPCASVAPGATCTLIGTYTVTQADVDAGQVFNTATADSDETDPPVTDTETTPVAQTTSLAVNKPAPVNADNDASGSVTLNDVLTYTITATNTGTTTLNNVTVSDSLITPTGGTTPCATVSPGSTCTLIGTYTVTQADVDAGQVFNTATADSDETDPPVTDTETTPVAQTTSLAVNKPAPVNADNDASGSVTLNDVLTYTITATNTGTTTLNNVVVSDSLITPTGGTTPCASVAPGATCTLIGTYTVTQADVDAGQVFNTATADSDETDPPITDTETTPVAQTTSLAVNKPAPVNADNDASGSVTLNDVLTYTITATNTGTTTLNNVTVSDSLITPTGGTTPCATVSPGSTCTLIGTYTVTQADVDAGQVFNTATADSDETDPPVTDTETTPVAQTTSLAVNKPAPANADNDASGTVTLNDVLTYTITATNTGTTTLNNVTVSDSLITPTGGTTPCAIVAPGSTCTLIGTYTVTQADVDAGQVFNTATADSDETDPPVTDTETTPVAQTTSLAVNKPAPVNADNDASGTVTLNDVLTYTITATNTGTTTLNNVTVSDSLITPTGGTTPCASVAPGGTCTLIGTYTVTQADVDAGQVFNTATADSDETDPPITDTETTPVAQTASLAINKPAPANADNDASGTVTLNDVLTYTITATNTGTTTLNNVTVSDSLITPTGGTTPCAIVAPGSTCTLIGTYTVTQADIHAGQVFNTATADSDETDPPVTDTETTPVISNPAITLIKTAITPSYATVGDVLSYTFTVQNTGDVTLTNITVTDPVATISGGPIASLAPGATDSTTFTATYTVTQADINSGSFINTAAVIGTPPSGPGVTDTDSATVSGIQTPALTLDKSITSGNPYAVVGDVINYSYLVLNSGSISLAGPVTVTDDKTTVTCPSVNTVGNHDNFLDPGESITCTASYTVTQADLKAGSVTNTARARVDGIYSPIDTAIAEAKPDKFPWILFRPALTHQQCPDLPEFCYVVSDRDNEGSSDAALLKFTTKTNSLELVNRLHALSIESMTISLDGKTLYGVSQDTFGIIRTDAGDESSFIPISPAEGGMGAGYGALGWIRFGDIDGMAFDPTTGILYGTQRRSFQFDILLQINTTTGKFVPDAFGANIDYIVIGTNSPWEDLDDLAIDANGTMYGTMNNEGFGDRLVIIDKQRGTVSNPAPITVNGMELNDMEGLTFYKKGVLLGTTGVETLAGQGVYRNSLFRITLDPARAQKVISLDQNFNGYTPYDFESVACKRCTAK